jgi:hypothetical protein
VTSENSQRLSLSPLTPQGSLDQDTDKRFFPEAVEAFRQSPDDFVDSHGHPTHHYSQARDDWGGTDTVGQLLSQHDIDPAGLTVTIFGGFTGEFARHLRDLGCNVIFTDPMSEWVEQARDAGFEAYQYSAEEIPSDLVNQSDAFATFECYYPFQTDPAYSLYTTVRMLTASEGFWLAETPRTRQVRQESGAGEVALAIVDLLDEYIEIEWDYAETDELRLYQLNQPQEFDYQSMLWAEVLSEIYQRGSSEGSTVVDDEDIQKIAEKMKADEFQVKHWAEISRRIHQEALGELADFLPSNQLKVGNREFEFQFSY